MSGKFVALWLAWIAAFVAIEVLAIADKDRGTVTLSQLVWRATAHPVPYICLVVFMAWLTVHFLSKGRIG